jgi:hypothetical protein
MPLYRVTLLLGDTYEAVVRARSLEEAKEYAHFADPTSETGWCQNDVDRDVEVDEIDETKYGPDDVIDVSDDEEEG